jgi:ribonucleotide reductase alpha subunit
MRNCAVLTIAPTGTTSILAATSHRVLNQSLHPAIKRTYYADAEGSNDRVLKTEVVIDPLFETTLSRERRLWKIWPMYL